MKKTTLVLFVIASTLTMNAQIELSPEEYNELKASGNLPESFSFNIPQPDASKQYIFKPENTGSAKAGGGTDCDCYIEPDASYIELVETDWLPQADDGSVGPLILPFTFDLYSDTYTSLFINTNGNVTFNAAFITFTPVGFPNQLTNMVAPFWADIDLRGAGNGTVKYKITPTAIYINWENVGYYSQHIDKLNTFQLILTDGTDPVIGVGNNASFCYKDMQWTTGDITGSGGFGGSPAVNGANKGDAVDFIQFAAMDHPGVDYDGPFGNADGVDWLDYKSFVLNTAVSGSNIAPIVSGLNICDTLTMCVGEVLDIEVAFLSPEQSQITSGSSSAPTLNNYVEINNTSGINAVITGQITATTADIGFHTVNFTATDDGTPPLTAFIDVVIQVLPAPSAPPVIVGDTAICAGETATLFTGGGFDTYEWSNGLTDTIITVGGGVYTVTGSTGGCFLVSDPFTVTESNPSPVIDGLLFACGSDPTILSTIGPYASYDWSNGSADPSISVGSGTYTVTVTDANGCEGISSAVTVNISPYPNAGATATPPSPSLPGTTVLFTDQSIVSSGSIVTWFWDFGNGVTSGSQNPSIPFVDPGVYTITLTVTTADGCSNTYTFDYIIQPIEVVIPNVFSPNSDSHNEYFHITGLEGYPGSSLTVYNRWGNVVYESTSYKNNWNAKDVSEGTYFYELKVRGSDPMTGAVTILR